MKVWRRPARREIPPKSNTHAGNQKKNSFFPTFEAGMLLKTKGAMVDKTVDPDELLKKNELREFIAKSGLLIERKADRRLASGL